MRVTNYFLRQWACKYFIKSILFFTYLSDFISITILPRLAEYLCRLLSDVLKPVGTSSANLRPSNKISIAKDVA